MSKTLFLEASLVSNHPVHFLGSPSKLMPSALIPFCAYGKDMRVVGRRLEEFSYPVCDSFTPVVHQGKLCYKLHLPPGLQSKTGRQGGLMLLIDTNGERSVMVPKNERKFQRNTNLINLEEHRGKERDQIEIYIPTLAAFDGRQAGSYMMTSLKKMTGTTEFRQMTEPLRGCQNEVFEDCQTRVAIDAGLNSCGCLPWALSSVVKKVFNIFLCFSNPPLSFRSPLQHVCHQGTPASWQRQRKRMGHAQCLVTGCMLTYSIWRKKMIS